MKCSGLYLNISKKRKKKKKKVIWGNSSQASICARKVTLILHSKLCFKLTMNLHLMQKSSVIDVKTSCISFLIWSHACGPDLSYLELFFFYFFPLKILRSVGLSKTNKQIYQQHHIFKWEYSSSEYIFVITDSGSNLELRKRPIFSVLLCIVETQETQV